MDTRKAYSLFEKQIRWQAEPPGFKREETDALVRHISLTGEKGYTSYFNFPNEIAERVIKEEIAYFSNLNQAFEWKVYSGDNPANIRELLIKHKFVCEEREALMVMNMDDHDHLLFHEKQPGLREITDKKGIMEIIQLEETIWKQDHSALAERLWRDKQKSPESLFLYGIYETGKLVSAAWIYLEPDSNFATLWGGSTLPEYRGKGYYRNLLAVRAQKAYEKGYTYLTVDAGSMSQPILEKAGFERLAYSWGCQSPPISNL